MAENTELKDAKMTPQEAGEVITLLERLKAFIDKHGIKGTLTTLLMLFIASVVGYFAFNPGVIFDKYQKMMTEKHEQAIMARLTADPQIRTYLLNLKTETNANRTFLLEAHNGGSNLTNLPFLYVDLTYAEPKTDFAWLEAEYKNVRLSRYPWAYYLYENGYWYGNVEEIQDEDPELYFRLTKENVSYIGLMMIYNSDFLPTGVLGIIYTTENEAPGRNTAMKALQKYTTIITPLLIHENYY